MDRRCSKPPPGATPPRSLEISSGYQLRREFLEHYSRRNPNLHRAFSSTSIVWLWRNCVPAPGSSGWSGFAWIVNFQDNRLEQYFWLDRQTKQSVLERSINRALKLSDLDTLGSDAAVAAGPAVPALAAAAIDLGAASAAGAAAQQPADELQLEHSAAAGSAGPAAAAASATEAEVGAAGGPEEEEEEAGESEAMQASVEELQLPPVKVGDGHPAASAASDQPSPAASAAASLEPAHPAVEPLADLTGVDKYALMMLRVCMHSHRSFVSLHPQATWRSCRLATNPPSPGAWAR